MFNIAIACKTANWEHPRFLKYFGIRGGNRVITVAISDAEVDIEAL